VRVLCVCNSGNVRSVTLGRQLKKRGAEVLCCGVDKAFAADTVIMLAMWADVIYNQKDSDTKFRSMIITNFADWQRLNAPDSQIDLQRVLGKIDTRFDVGPDDWKIPDHPDLHRRMREMLMSDPYWSNQNSDNA
jgi:hypothetical protein